MTHICAECKFYERKYIERTKCFFSFCLLYKLTTKEYLKLTNNILILGNFLTNKNPGIINRHGTCTEFINRSKK